MVQQLSAALLCSFSGLGKKVMMNNNNDKRDSSEWKTAGKRKGMKYDHLHVEFDQLCSKAV